MSRVLICEDDALLAADLATSVEVAGHTVHGVFTNASDAMNGAESSLPDVAMIDLQLADGHTGSGLAQALQALGVKVIVLSGYPNIGNGLGTIPHTYAAKPVSPEMVSFLLNSGSAPKHEAADFSAPRLALA